MQTAGYLVSAAAELTARMKDGKYNLNRRLFCLFLNTYRNTSAIINNRDRIIFVDRHIDLCTKAGQSFIDRIIHDLIDQVMQTSGRRTADIHTRTLSNGLKSFKNLNLTCAVIITH